MARRPLDIVVFGATGFTGRLVAEYLLTPMPKPTSAPANLNCAGPWPAAAKPAWPNCAAASTRPTGCH